MRDFARYAGAVGLSTCTFVANVCKQNGNTQTFANESVTNVSRARSGRGNGVWGESEKAEAITGTHVSGFTAQSRHRNYWLGVTL